MKTNVCCFIGHKTIPETEKLKTRLAALIESLIVHHHVDTFLFGSKSQFNDLCYEIVTQQQEKYPHIRRIYVRAEFPFIPEDYRDYLLSRYEDTYYPEKNHGAGSACYVERNDEMIRHSDICVVYFDETTAPTTRKSGTATALRYVIKQKKAVINVAPDGDD